MQYLSKAYNYYSGINPATLSGAIDVIVVRHIDQNGEETLSSSPFHVRFGKLQVLRAGEKRVTLRLPNNLPPPHMAPFGMKVGEAGEAFFVLETEEDVPEELMTSPVVMATDASELPPSPPPSDKGLFRQSGDPSYTGKHSAGVSLTQEPFGATEATVDHQGLHRTALGRSSGSPGEGIVGTTTLGEVEPLDLNALPNTEEDGIQGSRQTLDSDSEVSAASPSSFLNTASSLLPSIPFLSNSSSPSSSKTNSPDKDREKSVENKSELASPTSGSLSKGSSSTGKSLIDATKNNPGQRDSDRPPIPEHSEKPYVSQTSPPPNPLAADSDEPTHLPARDHKLSHHPNRHNLPHSAEDAQSGLPKVRADQGEGPEIVYGKDIVLDMSGYHEDGKATEERTIESKIGMEKEIEAIQTEEEKREGKDDGSVINLTAANSLQDRVTKMETGITLNSSQGIKSALVDAFVHDLMASAGPPAPPNSVSRPALPPSRATDPILSSTSDSSSVPEPNIANGVGAASSATSWTSSSPQPSTLTQAGQVAMSEPDLPNARASVSLNDDDDEQEQEHITQSIGIVAPRTPSPLQAGRRGQRGVSEPPVSMANKKPFPTAITPNGATAGGVLASTGQLGSTQASDVAMDYAWDWGRILTPTASSNESGGQGSQHRSVTDPADIIDMPNSKLPTTLTGGNDEGGIKSHSEGMEERLGGKLKNAEDDPYRFVLEMEDGSSHTFELSLCGSESFAPDGQASDEEQQSFFQNRITFQNFVEDPDVVDDPRLVIRYSLLHLTWTTGYRLLFALAMYRRSLAPPSLLSPSPILPPLANAGVDPSATARPSSGYGWARWWRRGQSGSTVTESPPPQTEQQSPEARRHSAQAGVPDHPQVVKEVSTGVEGGEPTSDVGEGGKSSPSVSVDTSNLGAKDEKKHYAKTLRLSSDQLKQLNLKPGPNTVQFSVTSSYSGFAVCTARIFLWEETDQVVISDIDGTITKSDALGHVFAAIGRDWTHVGIAKLYTDICNNGYKILYLTSRAIGQADTTREYLKTINQGDYRMPEGPVIMSPDRLMASLHREVIMRKPELFKMACLRDIQRLFGSHAKEAFFAGFGNRITDAMSYRSVGIPAAKIYTIDSTGVVKTELLQAAGHKGSYMSLNDLVNEVFPPVKTKFKPEFTDFSYWRQAIVDIPIPDLSPPSPALSARSDESSRSRLSVLGKITGIARRSSRQPILPTTSPDRTEGGEAGGVGRDGGCSGGGSNRSRVSRPSSPLIAPAMSADDMSDVGFDEDEWEPRTRHSSMPGSFEDNHDVFPESWVTDRQGRGRGEFGDVGDEAERGAGVWRYRSVSPDRGLGMGDELEGGRGGYDDGVHDERDGERLEAGGYYGQRGSESEKIRDREEISYDEEGLFDDDILAAGEMARVPF